MQYLCVLVFFFSQLADLSPIPDLPSAPGIYFHRKDAQWSNLQTIHLSGMKTKGLKQYMQTEGYIRFKTDFVCNGAHAPIRIADPRPVFYVRSIGSPANAMLVQFTQKKNLRLVHASPSEATIDNKIGFKREIICKVRIDAYSDKSFSITPQGNLKPGEYLLIFGNMTTGYDFGIDKP
jgi:hypothetical protein